MRVDDFLKRPGGCLHLTTPLVSVESAEIPLRSPQMRKSDSSNSNEGPSFSGPRYRPNWLVAFICFFFGAYISVALLAYDPKQSPFDHTPVPLEKNPAGLVGAYAAAGMFRSV